MIIGTGVDIVEIQRISRAINRNNRFVNRFFSIDEQEYFKKTNNRHEVIAGNFAAKEAFSKALGTGIRNLTLKDIQVLRDDLGKPYIKKDYRLLELVEHMGSVEIHVSISHSKEYAVANIIIEKR